VVEVIDRLLVVLVLVEILHTVRFSIRLDTLVTELFLVVGLIATVRRMLVVTLDAANLAPTHVYPLSPPKIRPSRRTKTPVPNNPALLANSATHSPFTQFVPYIRIR
jgi:hypothetical protein